MTGLILATLLFASLLAAPSFALGIGEPPDDPDEMVQVEPQVAASAVEAAFVQTSPAPLVGDAFLPLDTHRPGARGTSSEISAAPEPGSLDTSRFMMGSVAYALILPESNGAVDVNQENWTAAEIASVSSAVQAGVTWWAGQEPNASLSFSYDPLSPYVIDTSYEPINHPKSDEGLWINEVMASLGYTSGTHFDRVRAFDNALRANLGTDWAFTIFVVDSTVDPDELFADGMYFAYAYLGGPFQVQTYDNDGWGIARMDRVTAHETGHIFWATDEYDEGPPGFNPGDDDEISGYLNIQEIFLSECVMDTNILCVSDAVPPLLSGSQGTRGQIGWRDSGGNPGIFDILDVPPETTLTPHADPTSDETPTYTGTATVVAYPSLDGLMDVTINTIADVEFRVDGGPWASATPSDGAFDEAVEAFTFTVSTLLEGTHTIEAQAKIEFPPPVPTTILDASPATDDLTIDITGSTSLVDPLPTYTASGVFSVMAQSLDADRLELFYREDGGPTTSYGTDPAAPFSFTFDTSLTGGDGIYEFYTIAFDTAGNVESAPASPDASTTVDTVAPASSVDPLGPYRATNAFFVGGTASDLNGIVSVELFYRKDGGTWTSGGLALSVPYLWNFDATVSSGDGFYEFYSIAIDVATNGESPPLSPDASTAVDTAAPASSHALSGSAGIVPWYRSAVRVTLSAADATSGVATTMYRLDGGAWQDYTGPFDVTGEGAHTVEYASTDAAGNVEAALSVEFSVDLSPPELTITAPGPGALVVTRSALITWTASDSVSGLTACVVSVDGGPPISVGTATSLSLPDLRDGPRRVDLSCTDAAGHTAEEGVAFIFLTTNIVRVTPLGGSWIQILIGVIILLTIVVAVVRRRRRRANRT